MEVQELLSNLDTIKELITQAINTCTDPCTLDLVYKILTMEIA